MGGFALCLIPRLPHSGSRRGLPSAGEVGRLGRGGPGSFGAAAGFVLRRVDIRSTIVRGTCRLCSKVDAVPGKREQGDPFTPRFGAPGGVAAATRPPSTARPLPEMMARSTPRSRARRRAMGEARTSPDGAAAGTGTAAGAGAASGSGAAAPAPAEGPAKSSGNASSASPITAMSWPTGTASPSPATIRRRTPPVVGLNSTTALSVSISAITSLATTSSPSCLTQRTTVPSRMS